MDERRSISGAALAKPLFNSAGWKAVHMSSRGDAYFLWTANKISYANDLIKGISNTQRIFYLSEVRRRGRCIRRTLSSDAQKTTKNTLICVTTNNKMMSHNDMEPGTHFITACIQLKREAMVSQNPCPN